MTFDIYTVKKYDEWFHAQTPKLQFQIIKRLNAIELEGHFGHINVLGDGLSELKFNDGRRIYFTVKKTTNVILILGGGKNGQDSDIRKAKNALKSVEESAKKRS